MKWIQDKGQKAALISTLQYNFSNFGAIAMQLWCLLSYIRLLKQSKNFLGDERLGAAPAAPAPPLNTPLGICLVEKCLRRNYKNSFVTISQPVSQGLWSVAKTNTKRKMLILMFWSFGRYTCCKCDENRELSSFDTSADVDEDVDAEWLSTRQSRCPTAVSMMRFWFLTTLLSWSEAPIHDAISPSPNVFHGRWKQFESGGPSAEDRGAVSAEGV